MTSCLSSPHQPSHETWFLVLVMALIVVGNLLFPRLREFPLFAPTPIRNARNSLPWKSCLSVCQKFDRMPTTRA